MGVSPHFLLVRGSDLVVVGVGWSNFSVTTDAVTGASRLTAASDAARLFLTFPPQSFLEEKRDAFEAERRDARLSGVSRITFKIAADTSFDLTADGLSMALAAPGTELVSNPSSDEQETALEIPWHLVSSVTSASDMEAVRAESSAGDIALEPGKSDIFGLWRLRVLSSDGSTGNARLLLIPRHAKNDIGLDTAPLSGSDAQNIVDKSSVMFDGESGLLRPSADRVELTALGGSLSAKGAWPSFRWDEEVALGREQKVRVEFSGLLYPFGHHAVLTQIAERVFNPPQDALAPSRPAVASLQRQTILAITEPFIGQVDDIRLSRSFPFSEVEICVREFSDLQNPLWEKHHRDPVGSDDLGQALQSALDESRVIGEQLQEVLNAQPATETAFLDSDAPAAAEFRNAQSAATTAAGALADLLRTKEDVEHRLAMLEPGSLEFAEESQLLPTQQVIELATSDSQNANAAAASAFATAIADFNALPRSFEDLALQGTHDAPRYFELLEEIKHIRDELAAVASEVDRNLFFVPYRRNGEIVRLPLRLKGANADLFVDVPLIFLNDISLPDDEHFQAFESFSDSTVATRLERAWTPFRHLPVPGVPLDLVRSEDPHDGDIHEVQALVLAGTPHEGGFRPKMDHAVVSLPSIRMLAPDSATTMPVTFTDEFLRGGDVPDIALRAVAGQAVKVNFLDAPQRAGGLISPPLQLTASREARGRWRLPRSQQWACRIS